MRDDVLLNAFATQGDATAFQELVRRYTPIVYAAARRQIRDEHLAEDVAQAVFILLARKASSIRGGGEALPAWLINSTRLCALATLRNEVRRKAREARAAAVSPTITLSHPARSEPPMPIDVQSVERFVDDALCQLSAKDRTAVVLRYLQSKSQREVADAMGVSEDAAAQRLSRAVAKLRKLFSSRGMVLGTAVATEEALAQACVKAAALPPGGFATMAAKTALTPLAAGAGGVAFVIADSVLASLWLKAAATLVGASLGVLLTLAGMGIAVAHLTQDRSSAAVAVAAASIATTSPTTTGAAPEVKSQIRVGVYVSAATAALRPASNNAWYKMFDIADELKNESEMDVIPLVEPGSSEEPHEKRLLGVYFSGKTPIDVLDTAALRKLDAIVVSMVHNPPQQALVSIDAAVHDGTGCTCGVAWEPTHRRARPRSPCGCADWRRSRWRPKRPTSNGS